MISLKRRIRLSLGTFLQSILSQPSTRTEFGAKLEPKRGLYGNISFALFIRRGNAFSCRRERRESGRVDPCRVRCTRWIPGDNRRLSPVCHCERYWLTTLDDHSCHPGRRSTLARWCIGSDSRRV